MIPGASIDLLTFREVRRDPKLAPGGERFPELARRYLPFVHGWAAALVPENPAAPESVAAAVFETLAIRWKKPSRRTVLVTWLARTILYAAARERSRLGLKAKPTMAAGVVAQGFLKQIVALKSRLADAFLLNIALGESCETVALAIRSKPTRVAKRVQRATAKLKKQLKKIAVTATRAFPTEASQTGQDLVALLKSISAPVPEEVELRLLGKIAEWRPRAKRGELVSAVISAWRWRKVGVFVRRLAATVGIFVSLLACLASVVGYLASQGRLTAPIWEFSQRQQIKKFPGMAKPGEPFSAARTVAPANAAELYTFTNIWQAKIKMTKAQWRAVQPDHIKPVPQLMEGDRVKLRNPYARRSGLAGAIGLDFPWSQGAFDFAGESFDPVGVRIRGNGSHVASFGLNKRSFKVDLSRVKKGQNIGGISELNMVNTLDDYSYVHDALAEKLFRELGAIAPRTAYVYLTLDVERKFNDLPLGLYVLIENIDGDFAKDRFGSKLVPIFKPVTYELFADWGADWKAYKEVYDLKTKATDLQLARVVELAKLTTHADDEEFARRIPEFLDLDEYAAFVAGHVLLSSYDGYFSNGQNFYIYLDPRSNKFGFIPWDQDISWGAMSFVSTAEKRERASIWHPETYENRFLKRVMKVEAFREIYLRKLESALAGSFTVERLNREVDQLAEIIRPAVEAESKFRLERFETAISTNWVAGRRDGNKNDGTAFGPSAPRHQIKRFIEARVKSIRDQLDGKSEGERLSGFGKD